MTQTVKNPPAMQETWILSLGWDDPLKHPLWYFCLENPMDEGAWWSMVYGITKSQT